MNRLQRIARKIWTFGRDYGRPGIAIALTQVEREREHSNMISILKDWYSSDTYESRLFRNSPEVEMMRKKKIGYKRYKKPDNWKWDGSKWVKVRIG